MTQHTLPKDGTASEMMWDACEEAGGSHWVECSCGNIFTPELDDGTDEDTIDWDSLESYYFVEIDGRCFVYDCTGCREKLARYERFIWSHRQTIRDYLSTRINQEKQWADQEKLLNTIAGID